MERTFKGKSIIEFPKDYIVIDIETTGLSPEWDSIIEIAAQKYVDDVKTDSFTSLIQPESMYDDGTYIDSFIEELTGITNKMLSTAPAIQSVLPQYKDFIGDSILVGHNVNFDTNFIYDNFMKYLSQPLRNDYVDTMRLSRRIHPEFPHHRLIDLSTRYGIDYKSAHRAINDCEITKICYDEIKKEIINKHSSFENFINTCKQQNSRIKSADIKANTQDFDPSHPIYGKVCVFTGTLEKMTRKDAMQLVADIGGINGDSITKKTNYLILGNNDYCPLIKDGKSNKQKKAEKAKLSGQDIEVIPENVFYDLVSQ